MTTTRRFLPVLTVLILGTVSAHAQATRTYVSGVGDDANPCSRTAPCKTFAGAISKTSTGGEINVLDPGGFGAVTITKAISIFNDGVGEAGVLVAGTNGIVVAAGPADVVNLRGLVFNGLGSGLSGVQFNSGGVLNVENCRIMNFNGQTSSAGISFQPNSSSQLNVTNTILTANGQSAGTGGGILIQPQSGGGVTAVINQVSLLNNSAGGITVDGTVAGANASNVAIANTVASDNGGDGVLANSNGTAVNVTADTVTASYNVTAGIVAQGAGASVKLTRSTATGNHLGISATGGATLASYSNNNINGNTTDGSPSTTIAAK